MQIARETNEITQPTAEPALPRLKVWQLWALSALSGVLQVLIFPLPNWTFLCWIALVPLLLSLWRAATGTEQRTLTTVTRGFLLGWVSGIIFYAGSCYWVYHVMALYGGLAPPIAAGVLALFCLYVGLIHGLFGAVFSFMVSRPGWERRALLVAPFLWVATEFVRARIIGFPWDLLGTVLVDNIPLSRLATITGVYGLSFEIALINAALVMNLTRRKNRVLLIALFIFVIGIVETGGLLDPPPSRSSGTARLVQQNIPLNVEWNAQTLNETLAELAKDSVMQPGEGMPGDPLPDLVIWPESPAPFFESDPRYRSTLSGIAQNSHAYVLAGSLGVVRDGSETQQVFNSAELLNPQGEFIARYDKIHLVPFGEYVPFKDMFSFAKKLTKEVGDFVPGTERLVLPVHSYKLGTFICYESIFPDEVRLFARDGAGLLVNISNDGWFGDTGAPIQHLRMARMRAVENNRWVVRSTNTGVSVSIDPLGRVVKQLRRNVRVGLDVPYGVVSDTTFYTRHGDWFAWLCVIVTCAIIFIAAFHKRSPIRTGTTT